MNDIFNIVMPSDWLKNKHKVGADTCRDTKVGKFVLLYDESAERNYKGGNYLKKGGGGINKQDTAMGRVNTPKYLGRKAAGRF